jgi:hypothetical protein
MGSNVVWVNAEEAKPAQQPENNLSKAVLLYYEGWTHTSVFHWNYDNFVWQSAVEAPPPPEVTVYWCYLPDFPGS